MAHHLPEPTRGSLHPGKGGLDISTTCLMSPTLGRSEHAPAIFPCSVKYRKDSRVSNLSKGANKDIATC